MIQVGRKAFKESWSVRYLEKYVNNIQEGSQPYPKVTKEPLKPKFIQNKSGYYENNMVQKLISLLKTSWCNYV